MYITVTKITYLEPLMTQFLYVLWLFPIDDHCSIKVSIVVYPMSIIREKISTNASKDNEDTLT